MLTLTDASHTYSEAIPPQILRSGDEAYEVTDVVVEVNSVMETPEAPAIVIVYVSIRGWRLTTKGTRDKRQSGIEKVRFSRWIYPNPRSTKYKTLSPFGEMVERLANEAVAMTPGIDGIPVEIY